MFKIISDSACDLSKVYVEKHDVDIVPFYVSLDGKKYQKEGEEISRDQVYNFMVNNPSRYPKTSLPDIDALVQTFKKYTDEGIPVVMFTISMALSGCVNAANNAKAIVLEENPDARIEVIDTQSNTVTQALVVDQMVHMRDDGIAFDKAIKIIKLIIKSSHIFFTVGSLDYLQMGGRIGSIAAAATKKIDVKPVIIMRHGNIALAGIKRSRRKLRDAVINATKKYFQNHNIKEYLVSVGYGFDAAEGISFMGAVENALAVKLNKDTNAAIGITTAVHTGPYAIGIGIVKNYKFV